MIPKKTIGIIAGAAAAAIVIGVLMTTTGLFNPNAMPQEAPEAPAVPVTPNDQRSEPIGAYRINTECEMIYAFVAGKFPDGEKMTTLKIDNLISKYPKEFAPWAQIFANNDTKSEFLKQPFPEDFSNVLVTAVMNEFSINPSLKPIVMLITDPQGNSKLQQAFDQYGCQDYFDNKTKG